MEVFSVTGGVPLCGEISIHGAKNSVLPILAAATLCCTPCVLHNCPQIEDVLHTTEILRRLGCKVRCAGGTIQIDPRGMQNREIPGDLAGKMRSSVVFLGAILTRFGQARIPMPGGCPLGARPIDLHLRALRRMGAEIEQQDGLLLCRAEQLHGCTVELPFPSVGATENAILAALGCPETVTVCNAAREPEITDLIRFLQSAGAEIEGADTSRIRIRGGAKLYGTTYTIMPDRIETATYLCAAAACGGDVVLKHCRPEHLAAVLEVLRESGCRIRQSRDAVALSGSGELTAPEEIVTRPYPGFPTDAQAPMMAAMLRAKGVSRWTETIFEDRYHHVRELRKLGAGIELCGRCAQVCGGSSLHGARMKAEDLRGGAALVIGALSAQGESRIYGIEHLRRGYERLEENLLQLGANIKRLELFEDSGTIQEATD